MGKVQSEYDVEIKFIERLEGIGYEYIELANYEDVLNNFRKQLALFNKDKLIEAKGYFNKCSYKRGENTMDDGIIELSKQAGVSEEDVQEYLAYAEEYIASIEDDSEVIDGDEQLDYIYEKSNLDPSIIEKISDAEMELYYEDIEEK